MVRQSVCAVVAEVVSGIVAWVISVTDCGTMAEAVTAIVARMKTGRLVLAPGSALGAGPVGADICIMSDLAWPERRRVSCLSLA